MRGKLLTNFKKNKVMKYDKKYVPTQIVCVPTEQGESIEEQLRRIINAKQPIPQDVPPIYTPKEEGVIGDYNIRHDRFDTAIEAQDKWAASKTAKSADMQYEPKEEKVEPEKTE